MKRNTFYFISLALISFLLVLPGCNKPPTTGNSVNTNVVNGTAPSNTTASNAPKRVYQDMPADIMNAKLKGLDGKSFSLKDHKEKVLLVNLWATWCVPCRAEMPELIKLQDDYRDKGLVIVGLDVDPEPEEMVKKFVEKTQLNYDIGYAGDELANAFLKISDVGAIPQSFIITPDGKLAGVFKGYNPATTPRDVRKTIDEILARASE